LTAVRVAGIIISGTQKEMHQGQHNKAVGYVRVSTDKQADRGVSLDAQAEKIRAMAVVHGVELIDLIVDAGESAKSINRPGMGRMLALVDSGSVQTVIIAKLDRLTRSVKDLAELLERFQRKGVSLVSVAESLDTGSAAGRLVLNIMTAVSQWEREAIGERTTTALQHKKARRQIYSRTPYGYERDGTKLVPVAEEQTVISRMRLYRANGWTFRRIAETLNAECVPTKRRGQWFAQTIKDVIENRLHEAA
jgi:DNA invertase Pin-like site-specific DNA recombinase